MGAARRTGKPLGTGPGLFGFADEYLNVAFPTLLTIAEFEFEQADDTRNVCLYLRRQMEEPTDFIAAQLKDHYSIPNMLAFLRRHVELSRVEHVRWGTTIRLHGSSLKCRIPDFSWRSIHVEDVLDEWRVVRRKPRKKTRIAPAADFAYSHFKLSRRYVYESRGAVSRPVADFFGDDFDD